MVDLPGDNPKIREYLEAARNQWAADEPPPDRQQLRAVAESIGMSGRDSERADQLAESACSEAQQALDDGEKQRAERLLRDAVLLSPVRLQPFYLLARLYARRYGETGRETDHRIARHLALRAEEIDPEHTATRNLIDELGTTPRDNLPWRKAALIVVVLVLISGSMQLCNRYFLTPDVEEEQLERVREHFEEQYDPDVTEQQTEEIREHLDGQGDPPR